MSSSAGSGGGGAACKAVCVMVSETGSNAVIGQLTLTQVDLVKGPVRITGQVSGLLPGKHGMSVCVSGNLTNGASSCGPIFNPFGTLLTCNIFVMVVIGHTIFKIW
jgi:Cu/Zn superoxide dismutase